MPLPTFNPAQRCPKCDFDKITTKFRSSKPSNRYQIDAEEWLARRCERCEYIWDEACISVAGGVD